MRRIRSGVLLVATFLMLVGGFWFASRPAQSITGGAQGSLAGDLLRGRTIVIDPGHGGYDPGAKGRHAEEATINLQVATVLKKWFEEAGAHVVLTWSRPEDIPGHRKYRVRDRMTWINQSSHGDILIDIHCNSGPSANRGPQTFYWDGPASYHLAHDVQDELKFYAHSVRGVKRINQYVLRHAKMPAINVEIGFITNPSEEAKLMNPAYQQDLTWYIFIGTERWFLKGRWPQQLLQAPPPTDLLIRS